MMRPVFRTILALILVAVCAPVVASDSSAVTTTPIKHVIVLFQENVSFDHYFGTYPTALNLPGEQPFHAAPGTPTVNGLTEALLDHNPNRAAPHRLGPAQAATCDMNHGYKAEQLAFDHGLMDRFIEHTSGGSKGCITDAVMAYYDGNTVTALWNYAQYFAMNDNSFGTGFGPSTPGAINLISGNTHGVVPAHLKIGHHLLTTHGTMISDPNPKFDDCASPKRGLVEMKGRTIADLLNAKGISWGWFQGGFKPTAMKDGKAVCGATSKNLVGATVTDYSAHHEPFQYYEATSNPHHLPPTSVAMIGKTDQANHQYDLSDFYAALKKGNLPAVSFVKAKRYQDGHAGLAYSNPIDEQAHLVSIINAVEKTPAWWSTAIIIAWDDSDGWYDHVMPPILNGSAIPGLDALSGPGRCGRQAKGAYPGRCGYGPRLPLLVISPWARANYVDHTLTDQTSILRFIEDNWSLGRIGNQSMDALAGPLTAMFDFTGRRGVRIILDPNTGAP